MAYDETLERKVALKRIRGEHRLDVEARARLLREARALSQLEHPHICRIYDLLEGEEEDFLVLELIPGRSLRELIREGISYPRALEIALQVTGVLVATHGKGIIHRDLKPDNVMVTPEGEVKVLDFGLARSTEGEAEEVTVALEAEAAKTPPQDERSGSSGPVTRTEVGTILGTVGYMSPEQARGETATAASDMYSLGLLLQELFTGIPPYDPREKPKARLEKARRGETLTVDGLGPDLTALIDRLKGLEPGGRPSALDAADRLRWIRGKPGRRRRRIFIGAAMAAVTIFAVIMTIQAFRIAREAERANREMERANREAEAALQVSDFLIDLFEVSDPSEARGEDLKASEILERGTRKIGRELQEQPLTRARLLVTLGRVYRKLGDYGPAEELLREALAIRERELGGVHEEVADSLKNLADLYVTQVRYEECEPLYERYRDINLELHGAGHAKSAKSLLSLAYLYRRQGRNKEAEALCLEALPVLEESLGPNHRDVAVTYRILANLKLTQGKHEEGLPLSRRSVEILESILGPDHLEVAAGLNDLANFYMALERYEEAEVLYRRCLTIEEKTLGGDHSDLGYTLMNLGLLARELGRLDEAEGDLTRCLNVWEGSLGKEHPNTGLALCSLGEVLADLERHAEAEVFFIRADGILERTLGPSHDRRLRALRSYADLLRNTGREEKAVEIEDRIRKLQ